MRERGQEFILQLRLVMQPVFAVLDRGARFFRFIGAPLGFFFRLPQLPFDLLALRDVDDQPLTFGGARGLVLFLQCDVAERADHAGEAAVGIPFRMRAVRDVNQPPVLRDDPRFAVHLRAGVRAAERVLDVGAVVRVDQREPGPVFQILERVSKQHLQAARRRVDQDLSADVDARVKREVRGELADQPVEVLALAQA